MAIKTAILGASGYTGGEILRFAGVHSEINITALSADTHANKAMGEVFSHLQNVDLPKLQKISDIDFTQCQAVFCALPHGTTQQVVDDLYQKYPEIKIFDLSADFRLHDHHLYEKWYGAHLSPDLQAQAVYGLSEIHRKAIIQARLIANPGCYPTATLLPLIPLFYENFILAEDLIIDAKSGVTGAGRGAKQNMLYSEISESFTAYGLSGHRHSAELSEQLQLATGKTISFHFLPHLVPMKRGMLATIYCRVNSGVGVNDIRKKLQDFYQDAKFVHILPEHAEPPKTSDVTGSNQCRIAIYPSAIVGRVTILSVLDNLVKGASGQAIQNFNLSFGFPEDLGINQLPIFP